MQLYCTDASETAVSSHDKCAVDCLGHGVAVSVDKQVNTVNVLANHFTTQITCVSQVPKYHDVVNKVFCHVDSILCVGEDHITGEGDSLDWFWGGKSHDSNLEAIKIVHLVGLGDKVAIRIEGVSTQGKSFLGTGDTGGQLYCLWGISVIADPVDQTCCYHRHIGGDSTYVTSIQHQPVIGNSLASSCHGRKSSNTNTAVLGVDVTIQVIGMDDEQVKCFGPIAFYNFLDTIGESKLCHYRGFLNRDYWYRLHNRSGFSWHLSLWNCYRLYWRWSWFYNRGRWDWLDLCSTLTAY